MLGVCSWALRPEGPEDLCRQVREIGLNEIQIALDPLCEGTWDEAVTVRCLRESGLKLRSGMMGMEGEDYTTLESIRETGGVRPDVHWSKNLAAARSNAQLARRLGLDLVSLHAGFLPETRGDPERTTMLERLRDLVDAFDAEGVTVAFETGQEHSLHTHEGMDKIYLVIEGRGLFLLEGDDVSMQAGVLLVAPEGTPHGIRNTGTERLLVLVILAPAP